MIRASAPNKLHLAGEHSVVYGGFALVAPVEVEQRRNIVALEEYAGPFRFEGDLGVSWLEDSEKKGDAIYFPILDVATYVCQKLAKPVPSLKAVLEWSGSPKGTGNSASIPVALSLALYAYFGKSPSRQELYDAGFVGDNGYHGGKSSGGDVIAVLSNKIQKFRRVFQGATVTPVFEELDLQLPRGTELLLVESYRGGERATTAALIEQFAKAHEVEKKPQEMTEEERAAVSAPFDAIVQKIESLCHVTADASSLGRALDENHALLQSVTSKGIEEALSVSKQVGALGGKLIGAGGEGGSLIALVWEDDLAKIQFSLKRYGFNSWPVCLASRGPSVDFNG